MNTAYLLLGSNSGDRESYLSKAVELIETKAGKVISRSSLYSTAPWPAQNRDQQDYLNQAIRIETKFHATELLNILLSIEESLGRKRDRKWEARTIDIDILFYNSEIIQTPGLTVPHPFLHERRFALTPLAEIAGNFVHPTLKKTVKELLLATSDNLRATIHTKD